MPASCIAVVMSVFQYTPSPGFATQLTLKIAADCRDRRRDDACVSHLSSAVSRCRRLGGGVSSILLSRPSFSPDVGGRRCVIDRFFCCLVRACPTQRAEKQRSVLFGTFRVSWGYTFSMFEWMDMSVMVGKRAEKVRLT